MITFNLVMQANEDEVRSVASIEVADQHWDVVLCFEDPKESLELGELEEIPVRAAVRRLSAVLWRLLDYAADYYPPEPRRRTPNNLQPTQGQALHAGERVASVVCYLTEYTEATLDIVRKSPVRG